MSDSSGSCAVNRDYIGYTAMPLALPHQTRSLPLFQPTLAAMPRHELVHCGACGVVPHVQAKQVV